MGLKEKANWGKDFYYQQKYDQKYQQSKDYWKKNWIEKKVASNKIDKLYNDIYSALQSSITNSITSSIDQEIYYTLQNTATTANTTTYTFTPTQVTVTQEAPQPVQEEVPVDLTENSYLTPSGIFRIFDITEFLPGKEVPEDYRYESERTGGTWFFIPSEWDDQNLGSFSANARKYPAQYSTGFKTKQEAMIAAIQYESRNHSKITAFIGRWRFLSNFYPSKVRYESAIFPTVEHAYQAAKFLADVEVSLTDGKLVKLRTLILEAKTPGKAKRLARKYAHLQRPNWKKEKLGIMRDLLRKKFSAYGLHRKLIRTGRYEIIEGNGWGDRFWGMCEGQGKNHLGKMLMELREKLKAEDY